MSIWTAERRCDCGHARDVHEHYRGGTDCAMCGAFDCARFRWADAPLRRVLRTTRGPDLADEPLRGALAPGSQVLL